MQGLVPQPGIEPGPPAFGAWSPTHWTTREVPPMPFRHLSWTSHVVGHYIFICILVTGKEPLKTVLKERGNWLHTEGRANQELVGVF